MRLYLEIEEVLSEEERLTKQPQFVRFEVSNEDEAKELYEQLKPFLADITYKVYLHYCYHDEGKPCRREEVEWD